MLLAENLKSQSPWCLLGQDLSRVAWSLIITVLYNTLYYNIYLYIYKALLPPTFVSLFIHWIKDLICFLDICPLILLHDSKERLTQGSPWLTLGHNHPQIKSFMPETLKAAEKVQYAGDTMTQAWAGGSAGQSWLSELVKTQEIQWAQKKEKPGWDR